MLKIYVLRFSKRFPTSTLVIPHEIIGFIFLLKGSRTFFHVLSLLLELFLHISQISTNGLWEISLDAIRLSISRYSYEILLSKRDLSGSSGRSWYFDF